MIKPKIDSDLNTIIKGDKTKERLENYLKTHLANSPDNLQRIYQQLSSFNEEIEQKLLEKKLQLYGEGGSIKKVSTDQHEGFQFKEGNDNNDLGIQNPQERNCKKQNREKKQNIKGGFRDQFKKRTSKQHSLVRTTERAINNPELEIKPDAISFEFSKGRRSSLIASKNSQSNQENSSNNAEKGMGIKRHKSMNYFQRNQQQNINKRHLNLIRDLKERGIRSDHKQLGLGLKVTSQKEQKIVKPLQMNSNYIFKEATEMMSCIKRYNLNKDYYADSINKDGTLNQGKNIDKEMKVFLERKFQSEVQIRDKKQFRGIKVSLEGEEAVMRDEEENSQSKVCFAERKEFTESQKGKSNSQIKQSQSEESKLKIRIKVLSSSSDQKKTSQFSKSHSRVSSMLGLESKGDFYTPRRDSIDSDAQAANKQKRNVKNQNIKPQFMASTQKNLNMKNTEEFLASKGVQAQILMKACKDVVLSQQSGRKTPTNFMTNPQNDELSSRYGHQRNGTSTMINKNSKKGSLLESEDLSCRMLKLYDRIEYGFNEDGSVDKDGEFYKVLNGGTFSKGEMIEKYNMNYLKNTKKKSKYTNILNNRNDLIKNEVKFKNLIADRRED